MERDLSVNDGTVSLAENAPDLPSPADFEVRPTEADQGPCLYLGPAGQRCDRRALEGGFCAKHQPGTARNLPSPQVPRRAIAAAGVLAVLWPVLADLIRELMRLLR